MQTATDPVHDASAEATAAPAVALPPPAALAPLAAVLPACGGGGSAGTAPAPTPAPPPPAPAPPPGPAITAPEAVRFLSQASFGATDEAIGEVAAAGYPGWIDAQFARPQTPHRTYLESVIDPAQPQQQVYRDFVLDSFWKQAITGADQLRQRLAFALSEIFVVSQLSAPVNQRPRGLADYLDMLGREGFGNFRRLLEGVSLHPIMGLYLSHLRNQKEDPASGRVPDENYAREVMQLFTIGLYRLEADGSFRLDGSGQRIPTYGNDDVMGLARVFTGFSWAGPDTSEQRFSGRLADPDRDVRPMQGYPQFHSTAEKRFLGTRIPAGTGPAESLRIALDTLFNHPNVGPFFGRQLIQRLVTSNPSSAYVGRVAAAFNDNGSGVRGDMKAVLRAVLLDDEARAARDDPRAGKLREPVLRLAAWARAFKATSASGGWRIRDTSDPSTRLGQTPLRAASVFNFFRPGYVPPNTAIAAAGLVAPEFQVTGETSVAGYLNYMRGVIGNGAGANADVRSAYADEIALAGDPQRLVERVELLLTGNRLAAASRSAIRDAVADIAPTAADAAPNRARLAVFLVMATPEFIVTT